MGKYKQVLQLFGLYLLISIVIELIFGVAWGVYYHGLHPEITFRASQDYVPSLLNILCADLTLIIIILVAWNRKLIRLPECLKITKEQRKRFALPILLGISLILFDTFFAEIIDIPEDEEVAETFSELNNSILGILSICITGPILEEILMREGFLGCLLRNKVNPWIAIVATSLLFGAFHLNMYQFVSASIAGIILGLLYWKSGNIIYPVIVHILNNSISTILSHLTEDMPKETKISDYIGGPAVEIALCVISFVACIVLAVRYVKNHNS